MPPQYTKAINPGPSSRVNENFHSTASPKACFFVTDRCSTGPTPSSVIHFCDLQQSLKAVERRGACLNFMCRVPGVPGGVPGGLRLDFAWDAPEPTRGGANLFRGRISAE